MGARGFGIAAVLPRAVIEAAAAAAEQRGYRTFWVNDTPEGDGLVALAYAAGVTQHIGLGVGVLPLSRRTPQQIIEHVRTLGLPLERLRLGIGSGSARSVELVRKGLTELRTALPAELVVAALGPRMCRLAGEAADAVLLNWLTPTYARQSVQWVHEAAAAAGRPAPLGYAYVRVALGPEGQARLAREAATYEAIPSYAAHFARMGVRAIETAVAGETADAVQRGLAEWDEILDEVVVRAIPATNEIDAVLAVLEAAAPAPKLTA